MKLAVSTIVALAAIGLSQATAPAAAAPSADGSVMYRCPNNEYNNTLTAKEAKDKNCKTIEGAPITVISTVRQRGVTGTSGPVPSSGPAAARIDPAEQRTRDNDARRILEAELKREEERLAIMKLEYNNGEPERWGNEKVPQKYYDRIADMKSAIQRKEGDIAALRREIGKQPPQ